MSIKAGDRIPNGTLKHKTSDGVIDISTEQLFSGKKSCRLCRSWRFHTHLFRKALTRVCRKSS